MYSLNYSFVGKPVARLAQIGDDSTDFDNLVEIFKLQQVVAKYDNYVKRKARENHKKYKQKHIMIAPNDTGNWGLVDTATHWQLSNNNSIEYLVSQLTIGFSYCCELKNNYRLKTNFISNSFLFADMDDVDQTINKTLGHDFYRKYGSAYYASPSYREDHQKHRIIYKLETDITNIKDMEYLYAAIIDIHSSDGKAKDATRMFYGAVTDIFETTDRFLPTDVMLKMIEDGKVILNKPKPKITHTSNAGVKVNYRGGRGVLSGDTVFNYSDGSILFKDVTEKISNVSCPVHADKVGSEFLNVSTAGNIYFVCAKCGTFHIQRHNDNKKSLKELRACLHKIYEESTATHQIILSTPGVGKSSGLPYVHDHLIYARNSNKSVKDLSASLSKLHDTKKILTLLSFKELFKERFPGVDVLSNDSIIDIFDPPIAAWDDTFDSMRRADGVEARLLHSKFKADNKGNSCGDYSVVVCTTTTLKFLWQPIKTVKESGNEFKDASINFDKIQHYKSTKLLKLTDNLLKETDDDEFYYHCMLPRNFIVVIDDPTGPDSSMHQAYKTGDDLIWKEQLRLDDIRDKNIKELDSKLVGLEGYQNIVRTALNNVANNKGKLEAKYTTKNGGIFWNKKEIDSIINPDYRQIFTCAESIQVLQMEKMLKNLGIEYSSDSIVYQEDCQNAILLPSEITRAKNDGLLVPILEYIKRNHNVEFELISDGLNTKYNTNNAKGSNELKDVDIVTKISCLHRDMVANLEMSVDDSTHVELDYITDIVGQLAGRNQSHRYNNHVFVCIIDPKLYKWVVNNSYYNFNMPIIPDWVKELSTIIDDVDTWINGSYRDWEFKRDCHNFKNVKLTLRLHEALKNLNQTDKVDGFIKIVEDELSEVLKTINDVIMATRFIEFDGLLSVRVAAGNMSKNLLKVLDVQVRRSNGVAYFYITQSKLIELKCIRFDIEL